MRRPRELRLRLHDGPDPRQRFGWRGASATPRPASAVRMDLAEGLAGEPRRLTLVCGADDLHPSVGEIAQAAHRSGIEEVVVEGLVHPLADTAARQSLAAAGVTHVVAVVGGIRQRVYEHVTKAPGTFRPAMRALSALASSELGLEIVYPLLRTNADDAVPFVEWLLELDARADAVFVWLPPVASAGDRVSQLLPFDEQARIGASMFDRLRRGGIRYGFADRRAPSPCGAGEHLDPYGAVFHEHVRNLQRRDDLQPVRVPACESCSLLNSCSGIESGYVEHFGHDELEPVPLSRSMAWRLRRTDQVQQEYRNVSAFDNATGGEGRSLVRINGHCQMACSFCFVDRTVPDFDAGGLREALDALASQQTDHLVLSGGEPTLHPELPKLLSHGRALGFSTIEIQTNGVRCADRAYAESLVDAGLNKITVSLHSMDPEISDEITKLRGAFPRTVEAIHNFRALGVTTQIAHVITKRNYEALPSFVRGVGETFPPEGGHLSLCLAIAQGISDLVYSWAVPTFTEVRPFVREALDHCLERGIGFGGLIGQGGFPPCMLDGELRYYQDVMSKVYRSADHDEQFHKAPRCSECSFDRLCIGVRRDYVRCYGDEEMRPFTADVPDPAPALVPADRLHRRSGTAPE